MKRLTLLVLAACLALLPAAAQATTSEFAKSGRFGLGVGGSSLNSGLSGKLYLSDAMAVQATLGYWRFFGTSANVDVILEMPSLFSHPQFNINWNAGAGAAVGFFSTRLVLGAAGVLGISLQLKQFPLEITSEFRPTLLIGDFLGGLYWGGGGAIRYFF